MIADISHSFIVFLHLITFLNILRLNCGDDDLDLDLDLDGDCDDGEGDRLDNVRLRDADIFFGFTCFGFLTLFLTLFFFEIFLHLPVLELRLFPEGQSLIHLIVFKFRILPDEHLLMHLPVFGLFSFPDGQSFAILLFNYYFIIFLLKYNLIEHNIIYNI
jgi:hypothetical protein